MMYYDAQPAKRQATASDVFIVACLELGLQPDMSAVKWDSGSIDLAHFGLGDHLAGALAARYGRTDRQTITSRVYYK